VTVRIVRRAWPPITPEERARRLERMAAAAERMRRDALARRVAHAIAGAGPPMTLAEFTARLDGVQPEAK
jgi:hypothetical protein